MEIFRIKKPFILTILGASGDLAKIKIFPALFALAEQKRFPKDFIISGYARTSMTDKEFRKEFSDAVLSSLKKPVQPRQKEILSELLTHVFYFSGQYNRGKDFEQYKSRCASLCSEPHPTQIIYFSVPPTLFEPIIENVAQTYKKNEDIRLVLEKPFGHDETSATQLFHFLGQRFEEEQIYLLDHYLGKKAVRSLIPLRHMNRILNLMLKGREVANIQISALEPLGVENRIGYFDKVGAVKDMIQSHLLQILALVTMSIPVERNAKRVQEEKSAILSALQFKPDKNNISLGQYTDYRKQSPETKESETATFAAVKIFINRESWHGVPIFLRTGKKLNEKHTYLTIELKKFEFQKASHEPNRVIIELAPDETIHIRLLDEDGATARLGEIGASQSIACQGDYCLPEHGLLLLDVIRKEKMHFLSFSEILASWNLVDQILHFARREKIPVEKYKFNTCGPASQHNLMKEHSFAWYHLDHHHEC